MPVHNSNCKPFTFDSLVSQLYSVTEKFPDKRTGNNIRYTIEDAALGAFSIFFTQNPSFIDGINWVKSNDNPILELGADGTWDDDGTDHPMVIKNGTTYKMWYAGYDDDSHGRIGYATNVIPSSCERYFDNDGDVDGSDLALVAADFGRTDCP